MKFSLEELQNLQVNLSSHNFFAYHLFKTQNPNRYFRKFYNAYLKEGLHSHLYYLENVQAKFQIKKIYKKTKTILAVSYPYFNYKTHKVVQNGIYKISRYACGKDYHNVLKKKLQKVCKNLENFRIVVDSTPFPERYYARFANLGFIGKNGLLIHPKRGSYFFLAFVLFEKEIPNIMYQQKEFQSFIIQPKQNKSIVNDIEKYCANCTRCIDACPTHAITELGQGQVNTQKCISYQTIEAHVVEKPKLPSQKLDKAKKHRWIFGCDICQTVCPYNKDPIISTDSSFYPQEITKEIINSSSVDNENIKKYSPEFLYGSPLKRIGMKGIIHNKKQIEKMNL